MKFREITKKTAIDFIGLRNKTFILSAVLVGLGLFGFVMVSLGKANLSVDFTGGTSVQIRFCGSHSHRQPSKRIDHGRHRGRPDIQQVAGKNDFFVKTKLHETGTERVQDKIGAIIQPAFPDKKFQVLQSNMVGSSVGRTLKRDAIIAIILSFWASSSTSPGGSILSSGWPRPSLPFTIVLALLGIFYLLHFEMNILFITALLTIAGYSLTDTVVVYDRIRENMAKMKSRSDLGNVINVSINEVLSRTLITSLTVLLVLAALLVIGGPVLFDFAFALFIGVMVGTYSSIFVASPLIYLWRRRA